MSLRSWFRPPRLMALFLAVTLVPSVLLVALGWLLFQQDRTTQTRQLEDRRAESARLVVDELARSLSETEHALEDADARRALVGAADAVVVVFSRTAAEVYPTGRLAYRPVAAPGREADESVFKPGEDLEHRQQDPARAAIWFRGLARSPDPAVRAGALVRLARNLKKTGRTDQALTAYDEASAVPDASVAGVPVSLFVRTARCDALASSGRRINAQKEGAALLDDLQRGRWSISRAVYDGNVLSARECLGSELAAAPSAPVMSEALAAAVSRLWDTWQSQRTGDDTPSFGRILDSSSGAPVVVVRRQRGDELVALVAGASYVRSQWLARADPALQLQRVRVTLREPSAPPAGPEETRLVASETRVPWTIAVVSEDAQAEMGRLADRRTLWLIGLGVLTVALTAGTAVTARAVNRELAAARLQSDFVAAVSHEFRTPLTTLRQLTEILGDDRITSESRRHAYYQALARQTDRLQRLVESLLDFGRMEAGSSPYRLEPLEVMAFVRSVSTEFAAESAARGTTIDVQFTGTDASIRADRDALANALWNLLENAVKYSPDCRTIWVDVDAEPQRVAIRVRDQGFGIPREEQGRIFERFVRGSRATTDRIKGTGIGLSIVEHVVSAHGGDVQVESEPGVGSTFTLWLPRLAAETHASRQDEMNHEDVKIMKAGFR